VHGASDSRGQEPGNALNATVAMARIVKELGVPEGIIEKMIVTRASEIAWLSPNDLRSMGVAMIAKLDQIVPDQSTVSDRMQLPSVPATRVVLPPPRFPSTQSAAPLDEYCAARAEKLKELVRRTYSSYASYYVDRAFSGFCDPVTGYMSDYIEKASRTVIPLLPWPKPEGETLRSSDCSRSASDGTTTTHLGDPGLGKGFGTTIGASAAFDGMPWVIRFLAAPAGRRNPAPTSLVRYLHEAPN
jgi:hypothetical protein